MSWQSTSLNEVVAFQRGHDLPASQREDGSVPVIGSFGVTGWHSEARYPGPGVAIGRSGASIGRATFVATDYWPLNTCLFVTDFHQNDPRWVYWLLRTIDFSAYNSGSAQPSLNRNFLKNIPVLLPPVQEQRAIADILGALDDKIAANSRLVATASELAQAVTAQALLSAHSDQLGKIATVTMGSSPRGESYNDAGAGIVLFQGMGDFGERWPTPKKWTTAPTRIAAPGEVLISVRAPVGELNFADQACCIGRGLAALRSETPNALFHLLQSQRTAFAEFNSSGTIFGSINRSALEQLPIRTPDTGLHDLEDKVAPLEQLIAAALRESLTLAELRDTLLPKLMDSTLRVKDAEHEVGGIL